MSGSTLQNRLVGTVIVVALVVIVLPEFLDGEKKINSRQFVSMPEPITVDPIQAPKPVDTSEIKANTELLEPVYDELAVDDAVVADSLLDETSASEGDINVNSAGNQTDGLSDEQIVSESESNSSKPSETSQDLAPVNEALDIDVSESAWVVQLGSFRHQKNVKTLLDTLSDAGYRAYSRPVVTSVGELTKVFVGPELDRSALEQALPHLKQITKLDGKITTFDVSAE